MTIIVENGTGLSNAESYASVAFADAYFAARMTGSWDSSDSHKEMLLRVATEHIDAFYGQRFKGTRGSITQALQWPRVGVFVDGYELESDVIPIDIQRACCEFAYQANTTSLAPNLTQGIVREKIDVIEVEYDTNSRRLPQFTKAASLLAKYLTGGANQCRIERV